MGCRAGACPGLGRPKGRPYTRIGTPQHFVRSKPGNFPPFCAARSTLEAGFGRRMSHYKKRAPLLLRVRGKPRFTILAYSLTPVKGHGVRSAPPQEVSPGSTGSLARPAAVSPASAQSPEPKYRAGTHPASRDKGRQPCYAKVGSYKRRDYSSNGA